MADERKPFKVPGSKGITVPVGNTAQRPVSPDEGVFRYNTDSSSFEGYVGAAWSGIGGAGTSTWVRDQFTGNGSNTQFTLSQQPSSEDNLIVFEEGVFQDQDAYTISGSNIVFASAPTNLNTIVVYTVRAAVSGSNLNQDAYTANGTQTDFGLSISPIDENNTQVFLDGVYQHKDGYTVSGNTLTFSAAPSNGTKVEIMTFTQTTINQPGANTVGASALKSELGNTGVTVNATGIHIGQDVATTSNVTFHTVTANVSGDVTGNVSGDVAGNVTGHIVANSIVAAGHIIPNANVTYDLGNTTNAFRDLYLSGSTIKLGSQTFSSNATHISIGTAELSAGNGMAFARQEDIDTAVANLVASAPGTLDTLNELASALGNDASFSTTVTNSLALKAPLANPTFTGNATFDSTTLFIDGTNNRVGIGTISPSSTLHLVESTGPVLRLVRTTNRFDIEADTNAMGFVSRDSATASAYFSGFGSVGIGTSSPDSLLHLKSTGDSRMTIESPDANDAYINFSGATNEMSLGFDKSDSAMYITNHGTIATNRLVAIKTTGNVGIGVDDPSTLLQLYRTSGTTEISVGTGTSSTNYGIGTGYSGANVNSFYIWDNTAGKSVFIYDKDSGDTLIGAKDFASTRSLTLSGYGVDSAGTLYGSYGWLNFYTNQNYTASSRQWSLTNAYGANKFAFLHGDAFDVTPSLSTGGGTGANTVVGLVLDPNGVQGPALGLNTGSPSNSYGPVFEIYGQNPNVRLNSSTTGGWAWISMNTAESGENRAMGIGADGSFRITANNVNMDDKVQMKITQSGTIYFGNTHATGSTWRFNITGDDGRSLELEPAYGSNSAFLQAYHRQAAAYTDMYYYANVHNFYTGSSAELTFQVSQPSSSIASATITKNSYSSNQRMLVINHGTANNGTSYDTVVVNQYDVPCIRLRETQFGVESTWATGNENTNATVIGASHRLAFTTGNGPGSAGYVNTNERMQISDTGHVSIGTVTAKAGIVSSVSGGKLLQNLGPTLSGRADSGDTAIPRCIRDWYVYSGPATNTGNYVHFKTDLDCGGTGAGNIDYTMSLFNFRAYAYGAGVAFSQIGWHNWSGNFYNVGLQNYNSSWALVQSSYVSTDGKAVLVCYLPHSYVHISIDWEQYGGYTFRERKVTNVGQHSAATGLY